MSKINVFRSLFDRNQKSVAVPVVEVEPVVVADELVVETPVVDGRMAMVWMRVTIDSEKYIRIVRPLEKAIAIVNNLRSQGIVCGYDRNFAGKHCSSGETIRKMYAALGRQGITL